MPSIIAPREIIEFARVFKQAGHELYIVGGAVRDSLLGRPLSDFDAASDARPEEVMSLFRKVIPTGVKHGTVTVLWKGHSIETTTFRTDHGYSDGRRPDVVEFGTSIEADLERRDFTINAMAFDPLEGRLVDPQGGRADIKARLVRAVGEPARRFEEDGLRLLRALRFACQLDFEVEGATFAAIAGALPRLSSVSAERIRDELCKILLSAAPSKGLRLMETSGMLELLLPELSICRGVEQKGLHRFDVLDHLYHAVDAAEPRLAIRLAALLHDTGKPAAKALGEDGIPTFYRHEEYSAEISEGILRRLRLPNEIIDRVLHLVRQHMFHYEDNWTDAAVRRFLARVGEKSLDDLLALRMADSAAMTGLRTDPRSLDPLRIRVEAVLAEQAALGVKDLAIGGNELAALGVPRGPVMGRMLGELLEAVLDDPELNTRERLSEIARRLMPKHGVG
jgi:tRNA nucleotidyltransferase/poly(A) polymerase